MLRPTYAQIDLCNLKYNVRALAEQAPKAMPMAVVKANAYGHGAVQCAKAAMEAGAKWLAVATPDEALEVADLGLPVLILAPVVESAVAPMIEHGIRMTAFLPEHIETIAKTAEELGKKAYVHLKIDSGMGRIGLRMPSEMRAFLSALTEDVNFEGIFTHFATADEADRLYTAIQAEVFSLFVEQALEAGYKPLVHASNSAGILAYPSLSFDLVRMGISMYGYPPSAELELEAAELLPVMKVLSYIMHIKTIGAGDSVSYGRTFVADSERTIATVPIGYADGYNRLLGNKGYALVGGVRVPVVGRVCMDQIMLDITGVKDVRLGDEVVLIGRQGSEEISADEIADICGTISYEILTSISARVPRVFIDE